MLRAVGGIAHHYQLPPPGLPDVSGYLQPDNPLVQLALLVQAAGTLAEAVHHRSGMGMKRDKHGEPTADRLARMVNLVIVRTLGIANHYDLRGALTASIQTYYRNYQRDGFLPDEPDPTPIVGGPMRRDVLVVRHAQAHCNSAGLIAATTCRGLTETGTGQAERLARRLHAEHHAGHPVTQLYTSPVRRAQATARVIAAALAVEPVIRFDLRVPDPGPADGQPWDAARRRWPPDPDRPSRPLVDGGEPWRAYLARAHACLSGILADHPGGRIVVVGHSETVTALLTLLLGVPTLGALKVDLNPTGITRLTAARERPNVPITIQRWALTVHNDTTHLTAPTP